METRPAPVSRSMVMVQAFQDGLVKRSTELALSGIGILRAGVRNKSRSDGKGISSHHVDN